MNPILAISMGDPAGIGPEVALRAASLAAQDPELREAQLLCVGPRDLWTLAAQRLDLPPPSVHPTPGAPPELLFSGAPTPDGGRVSAEAVYAALDLIRDGRAHALVTAPLNKVALQLAQHPFPGHTELLGHAFSSPVRMLLQGGDLRVVLVTTHVAIRDVASRITQEAVLETLRITARSLAQWGIPQRRLDVCALNPHAGDQGRFGDEDQRIVEPALAAARAEGLEVTGPHPADTLFARVRKDPPGAVIAMYHDQGLIPVKMAAFGGATNITLGLPIVRTSPDHGTAYDIAGRGLADPSSMLEALRWALRGIRASIERKQAHGPS